MWPTYDGTRRWGQEPDRTGDPVDPRILRQISRLFDGFKFETPATHDRNLGKACWTSGARLFFGHRHARPRCAYALLPFDCGG